MWLRYMLHITDTTALQFKVPDIWDVMFEKQTERQFN